MLITQYGNKWLSRLLQVVCKTLVIPGRKVIMTIPIISSVVRRVGYKNAMISKRRNQKEIPTPKTEVGTYTKEQ